MAEGSSSAQNVYYHYFCVWLHFLDNY